MTSNKKPTPLTGAQRVKNTYDKKVNAGLRQIKVWVADDDTEVSRVRKYAAKLPQTKAINNSL